MRGKRLIAAGVAAATLAGGAYAFAANLTVTSQTLGAGTDNISAPTCTGLDVDYLTTYSANKYLVTELDLNQRAGGVHGCDSQFFKVTIADSSGTTIKEYKGQLVSGKQILNATSSTPNDKVLAADGVDAANVGHVTAVVTSGIQS